MRAFIWYKHKETTMAIRNVWSALRDAFLGDVGFSVIVHLKSGARFNVSMSCPDFTGSGLIGSTFIEGENIEADRQPIVIAVSEIAAYEIEY